MKTISHILKLSSEYLSAKNILRPRWSSEQILAKVLGYRRSDLYMNFDQPLQNQEIDTIRSLVQQRSTGKPLAYVLKTMNFYGVTLELNPFVLIPRPETEILVDLACQQLNQKERKGNILWDIGSGSGAIGLAMKKTFSDLEVTLSDLSEKAIEIAQKNAQRNQLEITTKIGDLFKPFNSQKADFIFSNPPYISETEYEQLDFEVKNFEPKLALLAKNKGLEFYERFSFEIKEFLNPGAKVFFEIGSRQGKDLLNIFNQPFWIKRKILQDWAGLDRFFFLELE